MNPGIMNDRKLWCAGLCAGVGKGNGMSVKKYRLYLLIIMLAAGIAGAIVYFYYDGRDETYRDGTLVQKVYVMEEVLS